MSSWLGDVLKGVLVRVLTFFIIFVIIYFILLKPAVAFLFG